MADNAEPEDVLDLTDEVPAGDEADQQTDEAAGDEDEVIVGFAGEEGDAPSPEGDSSVIRELRRKLREKEQALREAQANTPQPKVEELGPKPTIESFDFDADKHEAALEEWIARRDRIQAAEREASKRREAEEAAWAERAKAYEAGKQALAAPDFDDAEGEVKAALSVQVQGLLLRSGKGPELVLALGRNPAKLAALSKCDLADAAIMIGELKGKLTVERRKAPQPDRAVTGSAPTSGRGANKELERLEKEAARTGDRTALIRYRKSLQA